MSLTATYVKTIRECAPNVPGRPGRQVLFRLSCTDGRPDMHIVASAENIPAGPFTSSPEDPETCFFRSDEEGNILSYTRLKGSQAGTLDILKCITDAGYTLVGWRDDIADDYVATIQQGLPRYALPAQEAHEALLALRERVREAEEAGYRRGVLAARDVWKRRDTALIVLQNTDREVVALLPERAR